MIPGRYDFDIYKGGTLSTKLTGVDSAGVTTDFTQYTAIRMQIRPVWAEFGATEAPLVELTLANGGIIKTEANLALNLNMTAEATAALTFNSGKYDLELVIEAAGEDDVVNKFLRGIVTIAGEVTV